VLGAAVLLVGPFAGSDSSDGLTPEAGRAREDRGEMARDNCRARDWDDRPLVCVYGDPDGKPVVLFGDSHAMQWGPAMIELAKRRGWRLHTLLRAGCPIADVVFSRNCTRWRKKALRRIERIDPRHVIVSTSIGNRYRLRYGGLKLSRAESEGRLRAGMVRTLERLGSIENLSSRDGIKLIRDQVTAPFVPSECLESKPRGKYSCSFRNHRQWAPGFDWWAARETGNLPTIDPVKILCEKEWCHPTRGRIVIYRDTDHITATFARSVTDWFGERIEF
jgi:hypothetical protein